MSSFPRPILKWFPVLAIAGCMLPAPFLFAQLAPSFTPTPGDSLQHVAVMQDDPALLNHSTQGYLGVGTRDIDSDRAAQLKLKDARGAEIVTVDHDAPAAKAGLRVHDVILQMNSQPIEGEAQLRRMLRETPPGHTITLVISRDGQQQTMSIQLVDRSELEANAWSQHIPVPDPDQDDDAVALPGAGSPAFGSGFLPGFGANPLYTGLQLDMLGPQLANYFGVHDGQGLLVKRVDDNSPGAAAGLRAGDVIVRVNGQVVATPGQWAHIIHANKGKQIQLTVFRDRKEQTVNMTAGRGKATGELDWPECITQQLMQEMADGVPPDVLARDLAESMQQQSAAMLEQMEALRRQIESLQGSELE